MQLHWPLISAPYDRQAFIVRSAFNSPEGWPAMLRGFLVKEEGQGLVEYGLILVLIMVVVVAVLTVLGGKVSDMYSSINSGLG
jgi:pilus assembly protein Flp/PilA